MKSSFLNPFPKENIFEHISKLKFKSGISDEEGYFLVRLLDRHKFHVSTIVEIGSCQGKSACYMAAALKTYMINARIYCVDPWELGIGHTPAKHHNPDTHRLFRKNLKAVGLYEYVREMQGFSESVFEKWDKSQKIDFLLIDGGHQYREVLNDYQNWSTLMNPDGVIVFHDTDQAGVGGVINSWVIHNKWTLHDGFQRMQAFVKEFKYER